MQSFLCHNLLACSAGLQAPGPTLALPPDCMCGCLRMMVPIGLASCVIGQAGAIEARSAVRRAPRLAIGTSAVPRKMVAGRSSQLSSGWGDADVSARMSAFVPAKSPLGGEPMVCTRRWLRESLSNDSKHAQRQALWSALVWHCTRRSGPSCPSRFTSASAPWPASCGIGARGESPSPGHRGRHRAVAGYNAHAMRASTGIVLGDMALHPYVEGGTGNARGEQGRHGAQLLATLGMMSLSNL